jgi:tRNA/rRNA methyltransferase
VYAPQTLSTRFILVNTSHAGNVGAAARALKVMGFDAPGQLVLLAPRYENLTHKQEAIALASGALDVLENAQRFGLQSAPNSLAEQDAMQSSMLTPLEHDESAWQQALGDATFTVALTARGRDFGPPALALRELCEKLASQSEQRVAFVFGSERFGLSNELVYKANAIAHIPANPNYSSLNLAQSLMLVSYEWAQALQSTKLATPDAPPTEALATQAAVEGTIAHWEQALIALEFLDPAAPKKLMPRLQRLFNRAQLTEQEVHILRGIAKAALMKYQK